MKSCLLFILAFILITIGFGKTPGGIVYAQNQTSNQIQISAYVAEHIGFVKRGDKYEIATNLKNGLWLLTDKESASFRTKKVGASDIELLQRQIYIVPKI